MTDSTELIADLEGEAAHWVLEKDGREVARLLIAAAARIAELEGERDALKIERQALWGKLLLISKRASSEA